MRLRDRRMSSSSSFTCTNRIGSFCFRPPLSEPESLLVTDNLLKVIVIVNFIVFSSDRVLLFDVANNY